ncbi:MAG TPA: serine/threonine-protein kinase [Pirellulales bacterium]|nr:serine/threonine-protein kinase [Pirellulales bacterium]
MSASLEQIASELVSHQLLDESEFKAAIAALPAANRASPEALLKSLVASGKLTQFQASNLLQGRGKALVFGEYLVLDKIGAGGMGQVYRARHRRMKRVVAVKVLPPASVKTPEAVKRFQREVEAAARLLHPNIVAAFDAGEANGLHFLVMEYVEGRDLSAILKANGPLPIDQAIECLRQAACGLAYAHAEGIVHRDIKPANLLLDKKGTVKILDMGLARFDEIGVKSDAVKEGLTQSGQVMGTVDYMAPEQAADTHAADHRSDIYSLGCSFYRMLTGENVYGGDSVVKKIIAHMTEPTPSLIAKRPDVPPAIDAIFQTMVAKQPQDRYQSAAQLVAEIEAWRGGGSGILSSGSAIRSDPQLSSFLNKMGSSTTGPTVNTEEGMTEALGQARLKRIGGIDATALFVAPDVDTDPKSQIVGRKLKAESQKPEVDNGPPRHTRTLLIAAGFAGFVFLLADVRGSSNARAVAIGCAQARTAFRRTIAIRRPRRSREGAGRTGRDCWRPQ